jgi:hypothetical protein
VTVTADDDAVEANDIDDVESVSVLADMPACVTAIARVIPPPLTVTVPERLVVPVLAVALTVKLPLLAPLVGEALSQV